jgi:hypothetical protein
MSGTNKYFAQISSTNIIKFESPYGITDFTLYVRNQGKGNEVIIQSSGKPFMLSLGTESCRVKFDDDAPVNYIYNNAKESLIAIGFINANAKKFLSRLKTAEKLMIECSFYESGAKIIEFDVKGLEWSR